MVYHLETGVDMENWRRIVAGASALVMSAALPLISGLVFNKKPLFPGPGPGQSLGISTGAPDKESGQSHDNAPGDNRPVSADARTGSPQPVTIAAVPPATAQPAAAAAGSPATAAPTASSGEGGRGGGPAELPPPCGCPESEAPSSGASQPLDINTPAGTNVNANVSPSQPLSSSVEVEL